MRVLPRCRCAATLLAVLATLAPVGARRASAGPEVEPGAVEAKRRDAHLLDRLGFGATPAGMAALEAKGLDAWLDEQLAGTLPEDPALDARLRTLASLGMTNRQVADAYDPPLAPNATPEARRAAQVRRLEPARELVAATLLRAAGSRRVVLETMCDFFRNHLCVSIDKVEMLATEYDREVLRADALGSYARMLARSAKSPAMLVYLDNVLSRKPLSKAELAATAVAERNRTKSKAAGEAARDAAKQRGLNENYARELLELHTLGVDRFYTQKDVIQVALALTGWSVDRRPGQPIGFWFRPELHADGAKQFLGAVVPEEEKDPVREGDRILETLVAHKGTAQFLAWKLCRWLVTDDPPQDLVDRTAAVWQRTKGDVPTVLRALVHDPEFFAPVHRHAKFRRPFEFVVAALRVTGAQIDDVGAVRAALDRMNEPTWRCADPTGFYDQAEAWQDPGAIAVRWRFAMDLAAGRIPGIRIPDAFFAGLDPVRRNEWKGLLAARVFPAGAAPQTLARVDEVLENARARDPGASPREVGALILAALLGSPDFQRQ